MKITPGHIEADPGEHVVLCGPIKGEVVTADGITVDVAQEAVAFTNDEDAAEVAHLIGLRYEAEGHPDDPPGEPFVYVPPPEFADYQPHPDNPDTIAPPVEV